MDKLVVNVNEAQKETLVKLFEMLQIPVEVMEESGVDLPEGNHEKYTSALEACFGMWKDLKIDNEEYRKKAWKGRGI